MKRIALGRISTIVATVFVAAGLAASASAAPSGSCPNIKQGNFLAAPNVAAGFTTDGNVSTYWFASLTDENSKAGVPGLVKYCVYPDPAALPTGVTVAAVGANGEPWIYGADVSDFMFGRPSGNKSNIPLDGTTTDPMGTATWVKTPTAQTILLHIYDATTCHNIYGRKTPDTCFVLPFTPICNVASANATGAAYNSIPADAVNCGPPSHAFEATRTREFGDEVGLAGSGNLESLTVLFNSYACEDFPAWYNNNCHTTTQGKTFTHTITAHIYDPSDLINPIATATEEFQIPYRPSADTAKCDSGRFFNYISGRCEYSIKTLLTFTNWDKTPNLSGNVVWTVAFNTTHYGISPPENGPIGEGALCYGTTAGCPYDSLNVGTKTFQGAPYAGIDVGTHAAFINSTWYGIYCDNGSGGTGFLRESTNHPPTQCTNTGSNFAPDAWLGYTPLATITIK